MSKKTWIIFILACVALFAGLIYLSQRNQIDVSNIDPAKIQPAREASGGIADHVLGNEKATVTLIEYGDFQCPSCGSAHPNIKKIVKKYESDMNFVFRNFPITSAHPNALAASAAAEAAGLQGEYWRMHDFLFANQSDWSNQPVEQRTDTFVSYARQIGLDEAKFKADMASEKISQKIAFDRALAGKVGISSTPTFILNGKEVSQEISRDVVQKQGNLLDQAIADTIKAAEK